VTICGYCNKDMSEVSSCREVAITINKEIYKPVPYGQETRINWESERCHDCSIKRGGLHHPGCDVEECPVCHGQLISCGCIDDN
jgi:hypothetical protein